MTSGTAQPAADSLPLVCFLLLLLAPLAIAGLALINAGLGRSRSAAQSFLGSISIVSISLIAFALLGSSLAAPGGAVLMAAGKPWNWIGLGPVLLARFGSLSFEAQLGVLFQCFAAALTGLIPWGAGAERLRLWAGCVIAVLLSVLLFPLAAHWVWAGWLGQLGANFGMGAGFLDPAGAGTVHVVGGACALSVIWVAGARKGKFPKEGLATAMPGHNVAYVVFGCLVAFVGWMAWNVAGALLWIKTDLSALPLIAINTLLSAGGALGATLVVTRVRFGKPDASLCANGWMAGLVTSSACAALLPPAAALFTGVVAGIATPLLVEVLELAFSIDDPSGAISVHFVAGIWGLFALGVFAPARGQLIAQLVGISALLGLFLPLTCGLFALANRLLPFRVDPDGERLGMDLHELGGGAYPEFVIHRDESYH